MLLMVAAAAIAALALWPDGEDVRERVGGGRDRAAEGNADAGDQEAEAAAPDSWEAYTDDSIGYSIRYPTGWSVGFPGDRQVEFDDPATSTSLLVEWVQPPTAPTPEEAWESYSNEFAATHEGYEELGITPTTFQDMDAAAWEFTYVEDGVQLHAVDLGFITEDGETGMALFFQTAEEDWDASQQLFEQLKEGFEPPSG